jgi:hypothetical protein
MPCGPDGGDPPETYALTHGEPLAIAGTMEWLTTASWIRLLSQASALSNIDLTQARLSDGQARRLHPEIRRHL